MTAPHSTSNAPLVHVVARHRARPESVQEVREVLLSLIAPSRAEPGCIQYELFQNTADPTDFTFVEIFASYEALDTHAASSYIADAGARLAGLLAKPSEVCRYRAIG